MDAVLSGDLIVAEPVGTGNLTGSLVETEAETLTEI